MLKIWGRLTSTNVQKVIWCCEELGIAYERIDLGGKFGGGDDPAYRARNPNGLIPTIEDNGFVLWESHAILRYLAAGDSSRILLPEGRQAMARLDQWLDWQMVALGLRLRSLAMLMIRPQAAPPGETIEGATKNAATAFGILNDHLAASRFVAGAQFTIADIAVGISVHRWLSLPIQRPSLPAIDAWYGRVSERPAFASIATVPLN